ELFGDEIESIRTFNVENQRSVEEKKTAVIPPRYWVILDSDPEQRQKLVERLKGVTENTAKNLDEASAETLLSVMENDLQGLGNGQYPESSEYYAPYIHDNFATLLNYLPENALVIYDEWDTLSASLTSYEDKLEKSLEEG